MKIQLLVLTVLIYSFQGQCQRLCDEGQLSLDDYGRLRICGGGQWGTVCDKDFDWTDADVACKQLGYTGATNYETVGGGTGSILLGSLNCNGDEETLYACDHSYDFLNECDHSNDVNVTCETGSCYDGELQLNGGWTSYEGTLEICWNGVWNTICRDWFGEQEAYVSCRQMGLPASRAWISDCRINGGHGSTYFTKFLCVGNETSLTDCPYTNGVCEAFDSYTGVLGIVGLVCQGEDAETGNCSDPSIRLVNEDGANIEDGRIELCDSGAWGTVNNNEFSVKDAKVACRQLGLNSPQTHVYPQWSYTSDASGGIFKRDVACLGSEKSLFECSDGGSTVYLDHETDIYIKCWEKVGSLCTFGTVRLSDGTSKDEGRVELCYNGEWGTFCDLNWDRRDAQVICRELGYPSTYAAFFVDSEYFGNGDRIPYLYTDVNCDGTESDVLNGCNKNDQIEGSNCLYGNAVGVKCFNTTGCTDGTYRLWGGNAKWEGDVQVCKNGVWGFVCDNSWTHLNAKVACGQLGYSTAWYGLSTGSLFGGDQRIAPLIYDKFSCDGPESSLSDCSPNEYATIDPTCTTTAGATCGVITGCTDGEIRFQDGEVKSEGRLEVCKESIWTTIPAESFDYNDAKVICREKGYYAEWSVAVENHPWGSGSRMIYYNSIDCDGDEDTFASCSKSSIDIDTNARDWYWSARAGIACHNKTKAETCSVEGAVRLEDGATKREGRLEVCLDDYWGSVCNRNWIRQHMGIVACRDAGYETLRPLQSSEAYSEHGKGPVNVYNLDCSGTENSLSECYWERAVGESTCYHGEDVGLICSELPAPYYNVTITSNPEGPITFGTEVTLTCNVYPSPPSDATYFWTSVEPGFDAVMNSPSNTVTFTVGINVSKRANYYCTVGILYTEIFGFGVTEVVVEDLLTPWVSVYTAAIDDSVTLTFQQAETHINKYLRALNWYFEGEYIYIDNYHYVASGDGLSLTIVNVTWDDFGEYSIQYDGLFLHTYEPVCESHTLQILRRHPILAPATLWLYLEGSDFNNPADTNIDHINSVEGTTTFTKTDPSTITLQAYRPSFTFSETILSSMWYWNGYIDINSRGLLGRYYNPHYDIDLEDSTFLRTGFYELVLYYSYETSLSVLQCTKEFGHKYLDFITSDEYLGFGNDGTYIYDTDVQRVQYYEFPTAQLTSDRSSFSRSNDARLSCTGSGGYPRYYDITLWKNGEAVYNGVGNTLEYSTSALNDSLKYGVYRCVVNNMVVDDSTSVLLQEEATIILELSVSDCRLWNNTRIPELEPAVLERLEDACDCSLDDATLKDSIISCPERAKIANFTSTLVYSTDDGERTASTVIDSFYDEIDRGINTTLNLNGTETGIETTFEEEEDEFELSAEALAGILFAAGFLSAIVIIGVIVAVILLILYFVKWRTPKTKPSTVPGVIYSGEDRVHLSEERIVENEDDFELPPPPEDVR